MRILSLIGIVVAAALLPACNGKVTRCDSGSS